MPQYKAGSFYEKKLERVMKRLKIEKYDFDFGRKNSFIEFYYKGVPYRFEQSIENAAQHGIKLTVGSDCFAQLVLSMEDLVRMVERGIYDLQTWVAGMKFLPEGKEVPDCFRILGFDFIPTLAEATERYRELVKVHHPDAGGNQAVFEQTVQAYKSAKEYFDTNQEV